MADRDPGGPLVVVCVGGSCSGRRSAAAGHDQVAELQSAIRSSRGGVLVTAGCLGGCPLGALAGIAHRDGATGSSGRTVWLAGVHEPDRAAALTAWLLRGGPAPAADPDVDLPVSLVEAVAGLGPPPLLSRRDG